MYLNGRVMRLLAEYPKGCVWCDCFRQKTAKIFSPSRPEKNLNSILIFINTSALVAIYQKEVTMKKQNNALKALYGLMKALLCSVTVELILGVLRGL